MDTIEIFCPKLSYCGVLKFSAHFPRLMKYDFSYCKYDDFSHQIMNERRKHALWWQAQALHWIYSQPLRMKFPLWFCEMWIAGLWTSPHADGQNNKLRYNNYPGDKYRNVRMLHKISCRPHIKHSYSISAKIVFHLVSHKRSHLVSEHCWPADKYAQQAASRKRLVQHDVLWAYFLN